MLLSARIARRTGDRENAEELLGRYAKTHGTDDALAFEQLLFRVSGGDVDETAPAVKTRIAEGGQKSRLVREALVSGLSTHYRLVGVQNVLNDWLDESPDDPLAQLMKGKFLEGQMGVDEAVAAYRRALELDPELLEARLRLAHVLVTRRVGGEALAETTDLRARLPDNPEVRVLHAKALALQGRPAEARAEVDECLRISPGYAAALGERGSQELLAGDEQAAVNDLAAAVAANPGDIPARSQYALALARTGRAAESKLEYDQVKQLQADVERSVEIVRGPLRQSPHDPNLLHELGDICVRSGQVREGLGWYTKALEADPNHLPTHRTLAGIYKQLDNPVLAAQHRAAERRLAPLPSQSP